MIHNKQALIELFDFLLEDFLLKEVHYYHLKEDYNNRVLKVLELKYHYKVFLLLLLHLLEYHLMDLKEWDYKAGGLILQEAGGKIGGFDDLLIFCESESVMRQVIDLLDLGKTDS